jgi:hypothetical protein
MDEYGNWIYLTPMILGGMATVLAAAWKFLGIGPFANDGPLDALYALVRRIRKANTEAELGAVEDEIDEVLKAERAKAAAGDERAVADRLKPRPRNAAFPAIGRTRHEFPQACLHGGSAGLDRDRPRQSRYELQVDIR